VLGRAGEAALALDEFRQSLTLFQSFAATHPADPHWQRDLGLIYQKIGEQLLAQGNTADAQAALRKSLAIREKLAAADPGNPLWQTDVVVSLRTLAASGDRPTANFKRALAILQRLNAAGTLPRDKQRWIAQLEAVLPKANK
jgi:tetratricopeptide (TPR) repeat protein